MLWPLHFQQLSQPSHTPVKASLPVLGNELVQEHKRKDYAFRRQFNEKPSSIPGCPGMSLSTDKRTAHHLHDQHHDV